MSWRKEEGEIHTEAGSSIHTHSQSPAYLQMPTRRRRKTHNNTTCMSTCTYCTWANAWWERLTRRQKPGEHIKRGTKLVFFDERRESRHTRVRLCSYVRTYVVEFRVVCGLDWMNVTYISLCVCVEKEEFYLHTRTRRLTRTTRKTSYVLRS